MEKKLPALQGIRALACIGIFLFHSGFLPKGTFPVTLFFILSGFLIYYNEHNLEKYPDYQTWIKNYAWKKVKTFWPLHAVTFIASIFVGNVLTKISGKVIISGILNLFLLQTWYEPFAIDFNGLSWYLSCAIFLYFVAFFLIKLLNIVKKPILSLSVCGIVIIGINILKSTYYLYIYSNPLYRMLEFLMGMICAQLFLGSYKEDRNETVWEYVSVIITGCYYLFTFFFFEVPGLWVLILSFDVFVFASSSGMLSKILGLRILTRLLITALSFI